MPASRIQHAVLRARLAANFVGKRDGDEPSGVRNIAVIGGQREERLKSTQSGKSRGALRSAGFVPFADLQLIPLTGDLGEELSFPIDFFQIPAGFVRESQAGATT